MCILVKGVHQAEFQRLNHFTLKVLLKPEDTSSTEQQQTHQQESSETDEATSNND